MIMIFFLIKDDMHTSGTHSIILKYLMTKGALSSFEEYIVERKIFVK